ncbi:MAG: pirin family protein [Candidatus Poribacteria bacterium]|nr:pirin family protein [Candidatus Poribacteria bacterium]
MLRVRKSEDRGHFNHGWLETHHSFSFGQYNDPEWTHFRALRVLNEDWIDANNGFGMHPHRDMEIVTFALEGQLEHKDTTGGNMVIRPGVMQRMTAGRGIYHSEINPSEDTAAHIVQVWLIPERANLAPGYEEKEFPLEDREGRLRLLASRDARDGSMTIHTDVSIYDSTLFEGQSVEHALADGRHLWVQVTRGEVVVNGEALVAGDAVAVSDESNVAIAANADSDLIVFDLA